MFYFLCINSDSRQTKLAVLKAERQEKILTLEDAFEKIKKAIHVSDMEVMSNHCIPLH